MALRLAVSTPTKNWTGPAATERRTLLKEARGSFDGRFPVGATIGMLREENEFVVKRFGPGPPSMTNPAPVAALSAIAYSAAMGLVECVAATTMPSRCAAGLRHLIEPRNSLWKRHGEAAAAPEHYRRRDDQPQEGVAYWLDMIHGVLLARA
jgi:hypothetical protein